MTVEHSSLMNLLDYSHDLILLMTNQGNVIFANQSWKNELGYDPDTLKNNQIFDIISPDQRPSFQHILDSLTAGESPEEFEITLVSQYGHLMNVEGVVNLNEDDKNQKLVLVILRDITRKKQIDSFKNEFISMMSHEVRTPLTSILSTLKLILDEKAGELPLDASKLVEIAFKSSERLVRLINDILDIEKMVSNKMSFLIESQPLIPIIKQAVDEITPFAKQHQTQLKLGPSEIGINVIADKDKLIEILSNLFSNAVKYSPPGESISIRVKEQDSFVKIEVMDRGPGIPESYRKIIFEKFSQVDSSDSRKSGGTGLGLYLVKSLVEKMNGKVGFKPRPKKGSIFYIKIPTD
jgi:PAS domain S-box-containing protein